MPMMGMPMAGAPAAAAGGADAAEAAEKTEFSVRLTSFGEAKVKVIKVLRALQPAMNIKEAKELVESAPCEFAKGLSKEDAEKLKAELTDMGCGVEIK